MPVALSHDEQRLFDPSLAIERALTEDCRLRLLIQFGQAWPRMRGAALADYLSILGDQDYWEPMVERHQPERIAKLLMPWLDGMKAYETAHYAMVVAVCLLGPDNCNAVLATADPSVHATFLAAAAALGHQRVVEIKPAE